jgi:hypothetical protein
MGYLDTLTPEQKKGYAPFLKWWQGSSPAACLPGRGGTGKTYTSSRYLLEAGIEPRRVLGIAPTNAAAHKLSEEFAAAGFPAVCMTAHKALGLVPEPQRWGDKEQGRLDEIDAQLAKWDIEGGESLDDRRAMEIERSYLHRRLDAYRKDELMFCVRNPSGNSLHSDAPVALYDLYLVDEVSMTPDEIYELMMMEWQHAKILFMGDQLQMRPVGQGLSKAFSVPWIAEFTESKRASGTLKSIHEAIVACTNPNTAAEILKSLPYWDEIEGVSAPWDLPECEGCIISKAESRNLFSHWLKTMPFDGLHFRMVAYKNATVDKINNSCLSLLNAPCPQPGHLMIANSPLSRCGPDEEGKWERVRIAHSSELVQVQKVIRSSKSYVPGFGEFTLYHIKVTNTDPAKGNTLLYQPDAFLGGWKPDYHDILRWTNDSTFQHGLEFWSTLKSSLFSKGKPPLPTANTNVQRFFELCGADSWCNFVGVKGVKTYKAPPAPLDWAWLIYRASPKELAKFHRECFDAEGRPVFGKIRSRIYRLYKWLSDGAVDPVKSLGCTTVYKAQGQSIQNTAVLLDELLSSSKFGGPDATANAMSAIYTAVSRSSKRLYIVV